jgi:thiamine pyrophosphokinase
MGSYTVIVADGTFPVNEIPLSFLRNASLTVCCDGSAKTLVDAGFTPDAIVGDMDSLDSGLAERFADRIYRYDEQDTNDLTKAVNWCAEKGYREIVIIGATGKREDHTLGNISLLAEYIRDTEVMMVTDTGIFRPFIGSATIDSFSGQQVSIFSIDPETEVSSSGLKYPLVRKKIKNWWAATLNEATGDKFTLHFENGRIIVYLKFRDDKTPDRQ